MTYIQTGEPTEKQLRTMCVVAMRRTPPTFRELATHFGHASTNGVAEQCEALCNKGYLRGYGDGRVRSIELTRAGWDYLLACTSELSLDVELLLEAASSHQERADQMFALARKIEEER